MFCKKQFPDVITVRKNGNIGTGAAIQEAIDKAFASNKHCTIYIPCGKWILDEPLRLHPLPNKTAAQIFSDLETPNDKDKDCIEPVGEQLLVGLNFSVHLTGARPAFGGDVGQGKGIFTVLECTFKDAPAIDIQATRATTISNLAIEGNNISLKDSLDVNGALTAGYTNLHRDDIWIDDGVTEDHVAIAIDRHPGTGSSIVLIDNVNARFFAAGITIGTSGNPCTLNSEGHVIRRFHGQYLGKAGVMLGHHETKGITITDSFFFGQQYWIDCVRSGTEDGHPPTLRGCNIGATQHLFNIIHSWGNFACHGLYIESTLSIGTLGWGHSLNNLPAVFTGCQFNLYLPSMLDPTDDENPDPEEKNIILRPDSIDTHLYCHRPVLFQGCIFNFNKPVQPASGLRINNFQQVVFDTCTFGWKSWNDTLPVAGNKLPHKNPEVDKFPYIDFRSCTQFGVNFLHGHLQGEELSLGKVQLEKDDKGRVKFTLNGSNWDIKKGDFISFFGNHNNAKWTPKYHVPKLFGPNAKYDPYGTLLPFATIEGIRTGDTTTVRLEQVALSVYNKLPNTEPCETEPCEIFRWRYQVENYD